MPSKNTCQIYSPILGIFAPYGKELEGQTSFQMKDNLKSDSLSEILSAVEMKSLKLTHSSLPTQMGT